MDISSDGINELVCLSNFTRAAGLRIYIDSSVIEPFCSIISSKDHPPELSLADVRSIAITQKGPGAEESTSVQSVPFGASPLVNKHSPDSPVMRASGKRRCTIFVMACNEIFNNSQQVTEILFRV
jgi:hypothetical protein